MAVAEGKPIKGKIEINPEMCKGVPDCGECVRACPFAAKFSMIAVSATPNSKGQFFAVFHDPQRLCNGCALCWLVCPEIGNAITVWKEERDDADADSRK